jgi:hypothetical protein
MPRKVNRVVVDLGCGVPISCARAAEIVRYALNRVDWDEVCYKFSSEIIETFDVKQGERVIASTVRRIIDQKLKESMREPVRDKSKSD